MEKSNVSKVTEETLVKIKKLISSSSCGYGTPFDDGVETTEVPASVIHNNRSFVITVEGDSMYPTLQDGDKCLIDCDRQAYSKNVVAVIHDGEFYIKRLQSKGFSKFLISDNQKYSDMKINEETKILGVVYGFMRSVL